MSRIQRLFFFISLGSFIISSCVVILTNAGAGDRVSYFHFIAHFRSKPTSVSKEFDGLDIWTSMQCSRFDSERAHYYFQRPGICYYTLVNEYKIKDLYSLTPLQTTAHFVFDVCKLKTFFLSQATNFQGWLQEESYYRSRHVRKAIKHTWDAYEKHTMGADEIDPLTGEAENCWKSVSMMLIDNLDTLWLADLKNEYYRAVEWLLANGNRSIVNVEKQSLFEINIRLLGGLLSAYALTGKKTVGLLQLARDLADHMLHTFSKKIDLADGEVPYECKKQFPNFTTTATSIIKRSNITLNEFANHLTSSSTSKSGMHSFKRFLKCCQKARNFKYLDLPCAQIRPYNKDCPQGNIADVGTMILEFQEISEATGDCKYADASDALVEYLNESIVGYGIPFAPMSATKRDDVIFTLGVQADSYYEYLLKGWLQTGRKDFLLKRMTTALFDAYPMLVNRNITSPREVIPTFINTDDVSSTSLSTFYTGDAGVYYTQKLLGSPQTNQELPHEYLVPGYDNYKWSSIPKMEHLACYFPGVIALALMDKSKGAFLNWNKTEEQKHLAYAEGLTDGCLSMYFMTPTGIAGEEISYSKNHVSIQDKKSYLRPETVESLFYMWRLTKNIRYRNFSWRIFLAMEKFAKTEYGFASLSDITETNKGKFGKLETFVLSETLKYLYLIFNDDSAIDLSKWVFNTEAHPLPILGAKSKNKSKSSTQKCGRVARSRNWLNR